MLKKRKYFLYDRFNKEILIGRYSTPEAARKVAWRLYSMTQGACDCVIYRLGVSGQKIKYLSI